ncbi:hypothetical protein JTB14_022353 [Gonioctena quinquepunctata]|nr:hypothetical protein JTB14_022353 [Gonioctena quinquepunctata]
MEMKMDKEAFPARPYPEMPRHEVQELPKYSRVRRTSKIIVEDGNFDNKLEGKNEITGKTNIISEEGSEKGGEAGSVPRTYSMGAQPPSLNQPFDGKTNNSILFSEYEKYEDEYFAHLSAETDNEQEFYIAKFSRDYEKILEEHRKNKARCPEICQSDESKDTTKEHTEYSSSSEDGKSKIRGKPRKKILRKRKINIIHNSNEYTGNIKNKNNGNRDTGVFIAGFMNWGNEGSFPNYGKAARTKRHTEQYEKWFNEFRGTGFQQACRYSIEPSPGVVSPVDLRFNLAAASFGLPTALVLALEMVSMSFEETA